jgi:glycosyltransferase involved in cell wall biosynthesis
MRLDIVIPAFNEEGRIDHTLQAYRTEVSDPEARFLVALDACTDHTAGVVRRHIEDDPRVALLEYPKLGKGGVIMETFRHCDAEMVGFVDADCATPPAEFLRLAHMPDQVDGAIASRAHPASVLPAHRPLSRRLASWIFARLTRRIFGLPFSDTQCGAKVVRREVIEGVLPLLSSRDFLFDVDLLLTAERLGFRIMEVPTVWLDQEGSHVRAGADGRRMAVSSFRLWLHHRALPVASTNRPVRSAA